MDVALRVVGAITGVVPYLGSFLIHHSSYHVCHKRNVNDLKKQMAILRQLKADVLRSVGVARMRGDVIRDVVEGWLTRVIQMQFSETALNNALEDSKGCLQGNCCGRYQVGKDAKQMIDEVNELLNEGRTLDAVSDPAPLPPSLETIQSLDFQVYDSTKLAMDQIMEALKHEDVNMVGVYGLGGVGKTTLVKEVAKILKKDRIFDQVVMVTISQDPVWMKIQGEIAENLGLPLKQESLSVRARLLSERLKKEKRILIVMDDLWKPLNLVEEVGIPFEKNCKVVLTTRQLEVCNQMKTQFDIEVKVLSEEDAWLLFKKTVGDCIDGNNMLRLAKQIVKECGGLPIAIVTIGSALRAYKDRSMWEDAANQLKNSSSSPPDIEGVHEKVFCSIKFSYDHLASDATKFCFLLCSMFPEDYSISEDDLFPYVVGEGVFGVMDTLMEVRNRLHTQMERLKRSCLLLDVQSYGRKGYMRMHDVIRDVSIWIASKEDDDFVVKSGRRLTQFPKIKENLLWKCKRLSLMQNGITELPNRLDYCSQLMTLSLRDNKDLMEIPDGFFQGMTSLKTLDLQGTSISSMPFSLSCLTDLRVLCLSQSTSWRSDIPPLDVSLLGKLKKLEILHVRHSKVKKLPEEIGELTNLKSLNLSGNKGLIIAPNILSRLSLLEELNLEDSFHEWEMDGLEEEDGINSNKGCCLSEVASLSALTTLNIRVSNIKCLLCETIPFRWESHLLTRFLVVFGTGMGEIYTKRLDGCSTRVLFNRVSIPPLKKSNWVRMYFLELAEGLLLRECPDGLNNVVSSLIGEGATTWCFNNLRILHVHKCDDVISIIPSDVLAILPNLEQLEVWDCDGATEVFNSKRLDQGQGQLATLTKLKQLNLISLPRLRTIWEGVVSPLSLLNLEHIYVQGSYELKFMFSLAMAQRLQQLRDLYIGLCPEMVEIVSSSSIDIDENTQSAGLEDHHDRLNFSTNNYSSSSLLPTPPIFGNLTRLDISNCKSLEHIQPMSLAQGLLQLEVLEIARCSNLKEIISVKEKDEDDDNIIIEGKDEVIMCSKTKTSTPLLFPRLRCLRLTDLPNLSTVINSSKGHHRDYYYWPSLETLKVRKCRNLKRLPLSLTSLQNPSATKLREIWVEEEYWLNGLEWDDDQTTPDNYLQLLRQRGVKVIFDDDDDDDDEYE